MLEDFKKKFEELQEKNQALSLINEIGLTRLKDLEKPHEYQVV
jgi:hypothetical protein